MMSLKRFCIGTLWCLFLGAAALAAPGDKTPSAAKGTSQAAGKRLVPQDPVSSERTVAIGETAVSYRSIAAMTTLSDQEGKPLAQMFSISYIGHQDAKQSRPVTFVYNGGPGSSALPLHIGAFGPWAFPASDDGTALPPPPYELKPNNDSLLDVTDLVFIDPVGTGYSQAETSEKNGQFWDVEGDARSVAEFIRLWLNRQERWNSPVYLMGESYGGLRTAVLSALIDDYGIMPSGLILISPALEYGELMDSQGNDRPFMHLIPAMASTAQFHGRLSPELQALAPEALREQVRRWVRDVYAPACWEGEALDPERKKAVAEELSQFTAIPPAEILSQDLRISNSSFAALLLKDQGRALSLYDGRMTVFSAGGYRYSEDPLFTLSGAPYLAAFTAYLRSDIGFRTDRPYVSLNPEILRQWSFTPVTGTPPVPPESSDRLASFLRQAPFVKVFLGCGLYDLVTPMESALFSLHRMRVPLEQLKNIEIRSYPGGHMIYTNPGARKQLAIDLRNFYRTPAR